MHRVLVDSVTVTEFMAYDEKYMQTIQEQLNNVYKSNQAKWLRSNGIKVNKRTGTDRNTMTVCHIFYAELTDVQATEYLLRF